MSKGLTFYEGLQNPPKILTSYINDLKWKLAYGCVNNSVVSVKHISVKSGLTFVSLESCKQVVNRTLVLRDNVLKQTMGTKSSFARYRAGPVK